MILRRSAARRSDPPIGGVSEGLRVARTSATDVTASSFRGHRAKIPLYDRRERWRVDLLAAAQVVDVEAALLDASWAAETGYELFWLWGPSKGLSLRGLESGTAWAWSMLPGGYTHRGPVSAWARTDHAEVLIPCTCEDGVIGYSDDADVFDLVVLSKTTKTKESVPCGGFFPSSARQIKLGTYFQNTSGSGRDAYLYLGTYLRGRRPSVGNTSGRTQIMDGGDLVVDVGGLDLDTFLDAELSGSITGNGLILTARGAVL